jgi:hypothetical protein
VYTVTMSSSIVRTRQQQRALPHNAYHVVMNMCSRVQTKEQGCFCLCVLLCRQKRLFIGTDVQPRGADTVSIIFLLTFALFRLNSASKWHCHRLPTCLPRTEVHVGVRSGLGPVAGMSVSSRQYW